MNESHEELTPEQASRLAVTALVADLEYWARTVSVDGAVGINDLTRTLDIFREASVPLPDRQQLAHQERNVSGRADEEVNNMITGIDDAAALAIAREWANVSAPGVTADIDVVPVAEGWRVDVAVYEGDGPFQPLGTRMATILRSGELRADSDSAVGAELPWNRAA